MLLIMSSDDSTPILQIQCDPLGNGCGKILHTLCNENAPTTLIYFVKAHWTGQGVMEGGEVHPGDLRGFCGPWIVLIAMMWDVCKTDQLHQYILALHLGDILKTSCLCFCAQNYQTKPVIQWAVKFIFHYNLR